MMEKLGEPQTHLGLKNMIKEVDEDNDGQISFREVSSVHTIIVSPPPPSMYMYTVIRTVDVWPMKYHNSENLTLHIP